MISAPAASALTAHQQAMALRRLAEEEARRPHVVVSLSGAHAYGFPSPDSDLDVKAVHLAPAAEFLGFPRNPAGAERTEIVEGVEVDYSSNELGGVLQGVLKGNGNYIERFLSGYSLAEVSWAPQLRTLVQGALSKRVYRHYRGFATQQHLEWERTGQTSVKKLLYVLRTTLTGAHALLEGVVVTDLTRLLAKYRLEKAVELVAQKRNGELSTLPAALAQDWAARLPSVFQVLEDAHAQSKLPDEPENAEELEQWLIAKRLERLGPTLR